MSTHEHSASFRAGAVVAAGLLLAGCAFDIVSVKQMPAQFAPLGAEAAAETFTLAKETPVSIGTGFVTKLKPGTTWRAVGRIDQGTVFHTRDQVVTVEASHIHEAQLVVAGRQIIGFYLPVEKTFAPAKQPLPLETQTASPATP